MLGYEAFKPDLLAYRADFNKNQLKNQKEVIFMPFLKFNLFLIVSREFRSLV